MKTDATFFIIVIVVSAIIGAIVGAMVVSYLPKSNEAIIKDFYDIETVANVSPAEYLSALQSGQSLGTLVDLRSTQEYSTGHLITAVNIPAGQMSESQLLQAFKALPEGKPIITYCYASYCLLSANVGKTLVDNGIYAKHLTAGWLELERDYNNFVVSGITPGALNSDLNTRACSATGQFTC